MYKFTFVYECVCGFCISHIGEIHQSGGVWSRGLTYVREWDFGADTAHHVTDVVGEGAVRVPHEAHAHCKQAAATCRTDSMRQHAGQTARGNMQDRQHAATCRTDSTRQHAGQTARGNMQDRQHAATCRTDSTWQHAGQTARGNMQDSTRQHAGQHASTCSTETAHINMQDRQHASTCIGGNMRQHASQATCINMQHGNMRTSTCRTDSTRLHEKHRACINAHHAHSMYNVHAHRPCKPTCITHSMHERTHPTYSIHQYAPEAALLSGKCTRYVSNIKHIFTRERRHSATQKR